VHGLADKEFHQNAFCREELISMCMDSGIGRKDEVYLEKAVMHCMGIDMHRTYYNEEQSLFFTTDRHDVK
jgi:hypothetical protein